MLKKGPTQLEMVRTTQHALIAESGFEKKAGQCKRFVRQIQEAAGVPKSVSCPTGLTAREAAQWYRTNHPELICHNGSVAGDIAFWEYGHGPDGHAAVRLPNNKYGMNSTYFAPEDKEDGRGVRDMASMSEPSLWVRTWRKV